MVKFKQFLKCFNIFLLVVAICSMIIGIILSETRKKNTVEESQNDIQKTDFQCIATNKYNSTITFNIHNNSAVEITELEITVIISAGSGMAYFTPEQFSVYFQFNEPLTPRTGTYQAVAFDFYNSSIVNYGLFNLDLSYEIEKITTSDGNTIYLE